MLPMKALHGACNGQEKQYVDDVFSTYLYTGNGATQTINNGIDLAGKGGMVWVKNRTTSARDHILVDTSRGATNVLYSNATLGQSTVAGSVTAFSSSGFSVGALSDLNQSTNSIVSWTFRKAPKFFDVVTYTGNGVAGRQIPHELGIAPGMVVVKRTDTDGQWYVGHRTFSGADLGKFLTLHTTNSLAGGTVFGEHTSSTFVVGGSYGVFEGNIAGATYVAYLFAHDPSEDGIIQCGSFTTDASGNATVNLGWEPQWLLFKAVTTAENWYITDSMRGWTVDGNLQRLMPNLSSTEASSSNWFRPTSTGFRAAVATANTTYIYLAIRRPNKPPKTGTQVYNAIARTGTGAAATVTGVGFAPDLVINASRAFTARHWLTDKLRGRGAGLDTTNSYSAAEVFSDAGTDLTSFDMNGMSVGSPFRNSINNAAEQIINHFFRRAPGFMDTICFTGTGSNKTESHSLGKAPELWVVKGRSGATPWVWGSSLLANTEKIVMPSPAGKVTDATAWNSTYPTASVISLGTAAAVNTSSATYVCYLWATVAGISKVFSYTGDGGSGKVINCGFSAGARFVMIIRTTASTAQDIFIWDSVRGIVAANDPHLSLNTAAAEVTTDDSIDPDNSGFIVNQVAATNINVNGAVYIGLAIA